MYCHDASYDAIVESERQGRRLGTCNPLSFSSTAGVSAVLFYWTTKDYIRTWEEDESGLLFAEHVSVYWKDRNRSNDNPV